MGNGDGSEMKADDAIEVCTDAAGMDFYVDMQKGMLRAASYRMYFAYKQDETFQRKMRRGRIQRPRRTMDSYTCLRCATSRTKWTRSGR